MKNTMKKLTALSALLLLAACGGNSVSKSDVQKAINKSVRNSSVCVPFQLNVEHLLPGEDPALSQLGLPKVKLLKRLDDGKRANLKAIEQMDILADAGLYKQGKTERTGEGEHAVRHLVYELTNEGMRKIRLSPQGPLLCIGNEHVKKVNYFTKPSPANGVTVTQVSYEAEIVPDRWAKKLLKEDARYDMLKATKTQVATLVETNDGWRDIRDLSGY